MIKTLYPTFRKWSEKGSVFIISDTHFDDKDCKLMDPNWIPSDEYIANLKIKVHKNDTLIHLGDVGNPEWMKYINAYKVLITGNHDAGAAVYEPYFDEIYTGPLMISDKIILSHEPIQEEIPWMFNIHGHDHDKENRGDVHHLNLAANVIEYRVADLDEIIKSGCLKDIRSLHRITIDEQTRKAEEKRKEELRRQQEEAEAKKATVEHVVGCYPNGAIINPDAVAEALGKRSSEVYVKLEAYAKANQNIHRVYLIKCPKCGKAITSNVFESFIEATKRLDRWCPECNETFIPTMHDIKVSYKKD